MRSVKKKNSLRRKSRKNKSGFLSFFTLRMIFFIIFITPLLILSYYINRDQFVVVAKKQVVATAYSSTVDQTDSTPCITANGFDLCENGVEEIIANNGLKFGTKVRLPALFGDRVFTVADRMNARYGSGRIDIWMNSRERAEDFGARAVEMEIVK